MLYTKQETKGSKRRCKRPPFRRQKAVFRSAKGCLLQRKTAQNQPKKHGKKGLIGLKKA